MTRPSTTRTQGKQIVTIELSLAMIGNLERAARRAQKVHTKRTVTRSDIIRGAIAHYLTNLFKGDNHATHRDRR